MDHYQLQSFSPRSQWSATTVAQRDSPGRQASPEGSTWWTAPLGAEHCTEQQARWGCVQGWTSPGEALCLRLRPSAPSLGQLVLHMWIFSK